MNLDLDSVQNAPCWNNNNEKILTGPFDYLATNPGKELRKLLIQAFNKIIRVDDEKLQEVEQIVAILHSASLLIDDVEDYAILRRGTPAAHTIFGVPITINSSNYMYFIALEKAAKLGPKAMEIFIDEMLNLHRGQGMDLYWRESLTCPTEKDYIDMVMNKTGGLFRLAVRLMESLQTDHDDTKSLVPLANILGIIYQIRDDYMNLKSAKYETNKGFCEDITEGKFSFPIIHAILSDQTNKELISILKQKTEDVNLKMYAIKHISEAGSFDYCVSTLSNLKHQALDMIEEFKPLGNVSSLVKILEKLSDSQTE